MEGVFVGGWGGGKKDRRGWRGKEVKGGAHNMLKRSFLWGTTAPQMIWGGGGREGKGGGGGRAKRGEGK